MKEALQAVDRFSRRLEITKKLYVVMGEAIEDMERDRDEARLILTGNQELAISADSAKIADSANIIPSAMNLALGSLVRSVRERLGWSREVFGVHLGLTGKTIMDAEIGLIRLGPTIYDRIQALAPVDMEPGFDALLRAHLAGNQDLPLKPADSAEVADSATPPATGQQ